MLDNFLKIMKAITLAISLIKPIEELIPLPKKGKEKLDLLLGIIADAVGPIESFVPIIVSIVSRAVTSANATGTLASTTPPTPVQ